MYIHLKYFFSSVADTVHFDTDPDPLICLLKVPIRIRPKIEILPTYDDIFISSDYQKNVTLEYATS